MKRPSPIPLALACLALLAACGCNIQQETIQAAEGLKVTRRVIGAARQQGKLDGPAFDALYDRSLVPAQTALDDMRLEAETNDYLGWAAARTQFDRAIAPARKAQIRLSRQGVTAEQYILGPRARALGGETPAAPPPEPESDDPPPDPEDVP